METKESRPTNDATILVQIAEKLLEAQREIDELVLQFALGKAEVHDRFEETKKEFGSRVSEFKSAAMGAGVAGTTARLKGLLEELELQLNLGKANSKAGFEEQKKKIESVIDELCAEAKEIKDEVFDRDHLEHEIEKFKLKLEVLRLRFRVKKFEVRDSFKESMLETKNRIAHTTSRLKDKLNPERSVLDNFRKEAKDVYKHLRKVIQSI